MQAAPNLVDFSISTSANDPVFDAAISSFAGSRKTSRTAEATAAHGVSAEIATFLIQACPIAEPHP
jgi:hypothetical protein